MNITRYENVQLTRRTTDINKLNPIYKRCMSGERVLRNVTNAMNEGHTVLMKTDYNADMEEIMTAEIQWDTSSA